jgi:hypothetical protein
LQATLKERVANSAEETDRVQSWLKTKEAKGFLRRSPELKEAFSGAATAAKTLAKEQNAALAAQMKALKKVQSQLATF